MGRPGREGVEARQLQHVESVAVGVPRRRMACEGAHHDVLGHAEAREGLHELERAGQSQAADGVRRQTDDVAPGEADAALVGPDEARHRREERGLARAVRTDQPEDLALAEAQADARERLKPAVAFRELLDLEQRRQCRRQRPMTPWGRNTTATINMTP